MQIGDPNAARVFQAVRSQPALVSFAQVSRTFSSVERLEDDVRGGMRWWAVHSSTACETTSWPRSSIGISKGMRTVDLSGRLGA